MKKPVVPDLFEAVLAGSVADARRSLQAGTRVDKSGRDKFTALMLAAGLGHATLTELLIRHGADVNSRNDIGQSALMIAAKCGHRNVVAQLIATGADIRAVDFEKSNAVSWAVSQGDFAEVVSLLSVSGADYDNIDSRGLTPLIRT